jgi:uncharacterized protein (DUF58 family)
MLPLPTVRAWAVLLSCVGLWLIGLALDSWMATILGSGSAIMLACILAASIPLGRRVRAQRLEFAWWLAQRDGPISGSVVPHVPFQVRCYVRHRGQRAIELTGVQPFVANTAKLIKRDPIRVRVAPEARTEFAFAMVAETAGRVVLHGLSVGLRGPLGLFEVPLYFPNVLTVKVLPRAALLRAHAPQVMSGLPIDRSGRHRMRRRGGGTDLHELRELQPGDPFKSIAWKASARRGQLLVREVEQEVQQTLMLVLDVCGSMRRGKPGARKIDFALDLAAAEARAWLDRGDRVGLVIVDGRVVSHVEPGEGPTHMLRLYDALLGAMELVDVDVTSASDLDVVDIVARYVRHQDGIEFSAGTASGWDANALAEHIRAAAGPSPRHADSPRANTAAGAELRRFCRERGIILPHRERPVGGDRSRGIAAALRLAGGLTRAPRTILCISDMEDIASFDPLSATARLLQRHGHALTLLLPEPIDPAPAEPGPLDAELRMLHERQEAGRARRVRTHFSKLGVTVYVARPGRVKAEWATASRPFSTSVA